MKKIGMYLLVIVLFGFPLMGQVTLNGEWWFETDFDSYIITIDDNEIYREGREGKYRVGRMWSVVFPDNGENQNIAVFWIGENCYHMVFCRKDLEVGLIKGVGTVYFYGSTGRDVWRKPVLTRFSLRRKE